MSRTERLVADIIAAGGVLRLHELGRPSVSELVRAARRYGKMPPGKRLVEEYVKGTLELRLEDAIPGTEIDARPVPVPARVSRLHPVARRFREERDRHEVSRAALSRCVRIVHGLAVEADRRGYEVVNVGKTTDRYGREAWSGQNHGHLLLTIGGYTHELRIAEEGVRARGRWETEARRRLHYGQRHRAEDQLGPYDANATGRLMISVEGGFLRGDRQATWSDRKAWTLEERLPDVLRELEIRAAEKAHCDAEARREAAERRRRWEEALKQARRRYVETHRAEALRAQVAAWQEVDATSRYLSALVDAHGANPETAHWIDWIRAYIDQLDPLRSPPAMPETPEISPDDLRPFLGGLSPYEPPSR